MRFGIIGLGAVSGFYLDAIERSAGLEVVAVCDRDPARLVRASERLGVPAYREAARLLAVAEIDAVVVDTPVASHVELCTLAVEAGKHVCCEKPLALTRADAGAVLERAAARGATVFTAFHRRYNAHLPKPGALDLEGVVGVRVRYLEQIDDHAPDADWYATPASAGGGCIVDNGPNAVDVMRHLFGPMQVGNVRVTRSPSGVDLGARIVGQIDSGAEAVIELDWDFAGECKDLLVQWADGRELHIDMLRGFDGFKGSLPHEYDAIVADFSRHIADGLTDVGGYAATAWLEDVLTRAAAL